LYDAAGAEYAPGHNFATSEAAREYARLHGRAIVRCSFNIAPTWSEVLPGLLHILANGTAEGQRLARDELFRMAGIADSAVAASEEKEG
jgi:hypothetical protein